MVYGLKIGGLKSFVQEQIGVAIGSGVANRVGRNLILNFPDVELAKKIYIGIVLHFGSNNALDGAISILQNDALLRSILLSKKGVRDRQYNINPMYDGGISLTFTFVDQKAMLDEALEGQVAVDDAHDTVVITEQSLRAHFEFLLPRQEDVEVDEAQMPAAGAPRPEKRFRWADQVGGSLIAEQSNPKSARYGLGVESSRRARSVDQEEPGMAR